MSAKLIEAADAYRVANKTFLECVERVKRAKKELMVAEEQSIEADRTFRRAQDELLLMAEQSEAVIAKA